MRHELRDASITDEDDARVATMMHEARDAKKLDMRTGRRWRVMRLAQINFPNIRMIPEGSDIACNPTSGSTCWYCLFTEEWHQSSKVQCHFVACRQFGGYHEIAGAYPQTEVASWHTGPWTDSSYYRRSVYSASSSAPDPSVKLREVFHKSR